MPRLPSVFRLSTKLSRRARRSRLFTMLLLLLVISVLFLPLYIIYKPPHLLIRYFQARWPDVLFYVNVPSSSKVVALTLDDAPSEYTREIMEVLEANDAHATFFIIGAQANKNQNVLKEMVHAGHELGNHAMRDEPSRRLSDKVLAEQVEFVRNGIHTAYDAAGVKWPPDYFRPGSGFFSARMRALMQKLRYKIVLGGIYPHDPQIRSWRINARHILSMVRPGGIIVCHDRRGWTAPMLRRVLPELKQRGYRIVTVTELLSERNN